MYIGNLGSSKTSNAVMHMVTNNSGLPTYTNIKVKNIPNVHYIPNESIFIEETEVKGKKEITKIKFNKELWLSLPKPMNVILDEFSFLGDSRASQTSRNKAVTEMTMMVRRIIGMDKYGFPDYIMLVQRMNMVDLRIRELVTTIIYHILHWVVICDTCGWGARWNSEKENISFCECCHKRTLVKSQYYSTRFFFKSEDLFYDWKFSNGRIRSYYKKRYVTNIAEYFQYFDTLQYISSDDKKSPEIAKKGHLEGEEGATS